MPSRINQRVQTHIGAWPPDSDPRWYAHVGCGQHLHLDDAESNHSAGFGAPPADTRWFLIHEHMPPHSAAIRRAGIPSKQRRTAGLLQQIGAAMSLTIVMGGLMAVASVFTG
ncbi:hypothetical protein HKX42_00030 [Salinisphaera sp. USBA-960]|nr:hypothetical protein [Salifodinibacter halophilus]NNC25279.1 hypothetical protein [Salifodinibacter halophilus]